MSIMTGFLACVCGGVEEKGLVRVVALAVVGSEDMLAPILSFCSSSFQARNDSFVCKPSRSGSLQY